MIVLDASALTDWLLQLPGRGPAVAERMREARSLETLDLAQVEVTSALRRKLKWDDLDVGRAQLALERFAATPLRRHPASPLARRIWALRDTHSAYDAAYVALAEALGAPLITTDSRLARSRGHRAEIVHPAARS
jgi:predicted nucleic acid-binding protein